MTATAAAGPGPHARTLVVPAPPPVDVPSPRASSGTGEVGQVAASPTAADAAQAVVTRSVPTPAEAARAVDQLRVAVDTALGVLDGVTAALRRMRSAALDAAGTGDAGAGESGDAAPAPASAVGLPAQAVPGFVVVRPPGGASRAVEVPGADAAAVDLSDWEPSDGDALGRVDAALAQVLAGRVALASVLAAAEQRFGAAGAAAAAGPGTHPRGGRPLEGDVAAAAREQMLAGRRRLGTGATGTGTGEQGEAPQALAAAREAYELTARRRERAERADRLLEELLERMGLGRPAEPAAVGHAARAARSTPAE